MPPKRESSSERGLALAHASRRLGPWLVFAVVYADIGTSVYYVPGILYGSIGNLAALAQIITTGVFVSIALKYTEICARCPDGGGVVSITEQAFPELPTLALLGGAMITIDYFLTSAISGVSGIYYLASLFQFHDPKTGVLVSSWLGAPMNASIVAIGCLFFLLALNVIGLKESATVTATLTAVKLCVNLLLILFSAIYVTANIGWENLLDHIIHPEGVKLTARALAVGYADTWLAYSGLESAAQVAGAMREPARRTARVAMWCVIGTISVLSPTLTAFSTRLIPDEIKDPNSFISQLARIAGGPGLQWLTVISATLLLIMACNTAIVGNYHVNTRLTSGGFLPPAIGKRNRRFGTPHVSIAISAVVPMVVILATRGEVDKLGDLYSFGLLGTLVISSLSVDVLRWREHGNPFAFLGGSFTTLALLLAWVINLFHKPHALMFGGGITILLVGTGLLYRAGYFGRPALKPVAATWREVEEIATAAPGGAKLLSLNEAVDLRPLERSSIMVALRGVNEALLEDAALLAKGGGEHTVYIVCVDEVPGLFMPTEVQPTEEAQIVLSRAYELLEQRHKILALPIWRIGNDTALALAESAKELGVKALLVGTTKRSAIWHLLRGNVLKGLLRALPGETRLIISS